MIATFDDEAACRQGLYTTSQVRSFEDRFREPDGLCCGLMGRAGKAVADVIRQRLSSIEDPVLFLCGPGNNGGDGYAAAWELMRSGCTAVRCLQYRPPREGTEAAVFLRRYLDAGGTVLQGLADDHVREGEFLVDALLGIGLRDPVREEMGSWIRFLNRHGSGRCRGVLAVDLPSGISADTGEIMGCAVEADTTIMLLKPKLGAVLCRGSATDELLFDDLDIPGDPAEDRLLPRCSSFGDPRIRALLPVRRRTADKQSSGRVLAVGGAPGMPGAIRMCSLAALRTGAGLVRVASSPDNLEVILRDCPELMFSPVTAGTLDSLDRLASWAGAVVLGPGLGRSELSGKVFAALADLDVPKVVDADALYWLSRSLRALRNAVITPHEGEAARLLGISLDDVRRDRLAAAAALMEKTSAVTVLKGPGTVIMAPVRCRVSLEGCPGMAVGGMGDVLAGITGALLAAGLEPADAAEVAVDLHGRAGILASRAGETGTLPSDLLNFLRSLVNGTDYE